MTSIGMKVSYNMRRNTTLATNIIEHQTNKWEVIFIIFKITIYKTIVG